MAKKHKYAVVIDAGSSGSRVYVYQYKTAEYVRDDNDTEELTRLPKVKTKKDWHKKIHPGISTFGVKPDRVGEDHIKDLVSFAEDIVPKDDVEDTPIFLLATAGMRLLENSARESVMNNVCEYLQKNSKFQLPDCGLHIQTIPGETEGLYGWIAANYLLGGFDNPAEHEHGKGHSTYGFLDMGGASAQIAFAPNATEAEKHANDLQLLRLRKVNGEPMEYGVFVTTWLGFGANEARRRYVERLLEAHSGEHEVKDPCLPVGLRIKKTGEEIEDDSAQVDASEPVLVGSGAFDKCLESTYPLLEKSKACEDEPCLLNGVHTPAIDFDVNHFVGVSEYWHTTHEIFAMAHKDKAYDFHTYQKQVTELCEREWKSIEADVAKETWGHKVDEKTVEEVCFKASWLINMLHDGIGIPRVGKEETDDPGSGHANKTNAVLEEAENTGFLDPFQAVDEIDGTEVSWTLGKMVLYASSQMPPANGAMAVGFGSNVPGKELPPDFQYPSGQQELKSVQSHDVSDVEGQDWHDRILASNYSRRIPGILIVLVIVALAIYLLSGREKRVTFWQKITGRSSKPHLSRPMKRRKGAVGFLSNKLFGPNEPAYERVLEDAEDQTELELAEASEEQRFSDSSSGSDPPRAGRSSGWATPSASSTRGLSPDVTRSSPKTRGYFDSLPSTSASASTNPPGISPFERGGLVGRAESQERLDRLVPNSLRRSRTGSPKRSPLFAPLTPFKENVD